MSYHCKYLLGKLDPDAHQSEKPNPDQHQNQEQDPDPDPPQSHNSRVLV